MAKKKDKRRTNKPSKISRIQRKISSNKFENPIEFTSKELNIKSNFIFYILLFSTFLSLTLFIFYFLRSLDPFSYLVSFYSPEKALVYFFITSFGFVIVCLLVGSLYIDKFEKRLPAYREIFFGLNAAIITLIVYPISTGYNPLINYPLIGIILFVVDIVVELTPIAIGYKIFKNIKSV